MSSPWNIAHRGAPTLATENTLSSFEAALRFNVEAIELDIHLTKDQRFVVHHDETLGRTIEGQGNISDYTLKELKQLRVIDAPRSEKIPSLEEVLDLCRGKCHLAVEAKLEESNAKTFATVLAKTMKAETKPADATVISFCHPLIRGFRELAPKYPAGPSFQKRMSPTVAFALEPSVVVMARQIVTKSSAEPYFKKQIPIWVYTVDDKKEWTRLENIGVAGIITNRPDRFSS